MICPHCGKPVSRKISAEMRAKVKDLRQQGYSLRDIEAMTGVSFSNVRRITLSSASN